MKKETKINKITIALTDTQIQHLEELKQNSNNKTITKVVYDLINKSMIFNK